MRNNKGFAISGIMYAILIISLLLVLGTLKTLQNRKTIIDKVKSETADALEINNYQELLSKVEQLENGIIDKIYPVGSIYISTSSANPSTIFGNDTTWESFGQGRTLIGAGTNGGYTFTAGSTGTTIGATTNPLGEYTHGLTTNELPSNMGTFTAFKWKTSNAATGIVSSVQPDPVRIADESNNPFLGTATYTLSGGGQAHNNIQPYIVTYMWKRTS